MLFNVVGISALVFESSHLGCGPFRKELFIQCSPMIFLDIFLVGFQGQVFRGAHVSFAGFLGWMLDGA